MFRMGDLDVKHLHLMNGLHPAQIHQVSEWSIMQSSALVLNAVLEPCWTRELATKVAASRSARTGRTGELKPPLISALHT